MKIPPLPRAVIGFLFFASSLCAAPADEVGAILLHFLKQPNYTWTAGGLTPGRSEGGRGPLAAGGQHERGGYTKVDFLTGLHIPAKETPSTRSWAGFCAEQGDLASRWIFETRSGWTFLGSLPGASGGGERVFAFRRPDHEIAMLFDHLAVVEAKGDGIYLCRLTAAGAGAFAFPPYPAPRESAYTGNSFPSDRARLRADGTYREELNPAETAALAPPPPAFRGGQGHPMGSVERAGGNVLIRTENGTLAQYEIHITAFITFRGTTNQVQLSLIRDLKDLGRTQVDIPAEVKQKLGRPR